MRRRSESTIKYLAKGVYYMIYSRVRVPIHIHIHNYNHFIPCPFHTKSYPSIYSFIPPCTQLQNKTQSINA